MGELKPPGKPFDISKWEVQDAWEKVQANKGAPGVDEVTLAEFEKDLRGNLYKIWLCRVGDYAERAVLGADPSSSGVRNAGEGLGIILAH
jgi:hypothetical protein